MKEVGDRDIVLGDLENSKSQWDFGYHRCFKVEEAKGVVRKMSQVRVIGPNEIPIEF